MVVVPSSSVSQTQESETTGHVRGQLGQMAVESCGGQSGVRGHRIPVGTDNRT